MTSLTDSAGAIVATYVYDSFGNLTASTGTVENLYRYTAREFDSETGLYYYRARYYDPSIGRFLNEDPIGFDGGINFYAYVRNNPPNFFDPSGLKGGCEVTGFRLTPWVTWTTRTDFGPWKFLRSDVIAQGGVFSPPVLLCRWERQYRRTQYRKALFLVGMSCWDETPCGTKTSEKFFPLQFQGIQETIGSSIEKERKTKNAIDMPGSTGVNNLLCTSSPWMRP